MDGIKIKDLCFAYGKKQILKNVSCDIQKSSFVSVVGPNGAGKSTLIKCINKILKPQSGTIEIFGEKLKNMKRKKVAKTISYVPQGSNRIFPTTVFDTVMMGRRPHLAWFNNEEDKEKVWKVLEDMGLDNLALANFTELSGGQQQKILIARAIVQDTRLILLDEPTSNLDIWHQIDVMENIQRLGRERELTALMVVHDLNMASKYSDTIIMMKDGKIESIGTPKQVLTLETIKKVYDVDAHIYSHSDVTYVMPLKQTEKD